MRRRRRMGSFVKAAEIAIAAPQVVVIRTARMLAAGTSPNSRDRAEFSRMGTEKVQAFWESMFAMTRQAAIANQEYTRVAFLRWWGVWTKPWWLLAYRPASQAIASVAQSVASESTHMHRQRLSAVSKVIEHGLSPVHKRATANARRLTRIRKRP
jgi:hypothetical protein